MESAFTAGQTLHNQSSSFISQDCHNCSLSKKIAVRRSLFAFRV